MKLPRRNFLHLAAGAAALPAVSRIARRKPIRRGRSGSWFHFRRVAAGPSSPSKFYGAGRWMPNLFSTAAPWSLPGTSTKGSWFIVWLTRRVAGIC